MLDEARVEAMAQGGSEIAALPDPVGAYARDLDAAQRPRIERVATPLGVIGIIFESRPNVTADAGALCLKAGNAAILRGGSESFRTSTRDRSGTAARARSGRPAGERHPARADDGPRCRRRDAEGLDGAIDVIVPRGGKSLVARVQEEARVPVFAHLEGICHVYVDAAADLDMAQRDRRSTPRCGAPASAARPRRCWSIALSQRPISTPLVRCCSTPAARCAAMRERRAPIRA